MPQHTITLTAAQKTALTTAYNNLTTLADSAQWKTAMRLLAAMTPARRAEVLAGYNRLRLLLELGEKLRIG